MLTEEEKARIRAEEVFRLEVRRTLDAAKPQLSPRQSLWLWLNSAFGLWLLFSVVLAGLTTTYTRYQNQRAQHVKKEEAEKRLNTEISGRMFEALKGLTSYQNDVRDGKLGPPADVYGTVVQYLDNSFVFESSNPKDLSIYPEFQKQNFQSLLIELSSLSNADQAQAREAFDKYIALKDLASEDDTTKGPEERRRACLKAVGDSQQTLTGLMRGPWQPQL